MHLSVQLTPEAARALHAAPSPSSAPRDLQALARLLTPVHPGATEAALQVFFFAEADDEARASSLIDSLRRDPHVTAAYIKPADEAP